MQNMNDLSARTNFDNGSQNSSNYSGDPPDSLAPTWPAGSISQRVKKLSWDDDDRVSFTILRVFFFVFLFGKLIFFVLQTVDSVEVTAETRPCNSKAANEQLNLTVYF